jgi:hypothetical protein
VAGDVVEDGEREQIAGADRIEENEEIHRKGEKKQRKGSTARPISYIMLTTRYEAGL